MRILRLRIKHYRGVAEREIRFARSGITIVAGPNEIGKSSLAEAIDLVFDELDSSTKQRVRNIQPVDRDEGAEIEVEVETGPYAFTCSKRFQRRPATQLSVTRPSQEHHSGREAHQRMREILDETLDAHLWRALRVQQGQGLEQASWLGQAALSEALDRAAGSLPAEGASEESIFEVVSHERARYFTPSGRARRELDTLERAAGQATREADALAEALASLEEDVNRAAQLRGRIAELEPEVRQAELALREQEQAFQSISALRDGLRTTEAQRDTARLEEREAIRAARQRGQLVTAHAAAEADLAQRHEEVESGEPTLLAARAEFEHTERAATKARESLDAASRSDAQRHAELELRRCEHDLATLRTRIAQLGEAERAVEAARVEVQARPLSPEQVHEIRDAELEVERARARVESEGPLVQLTAVRPLEADVDGQRARIAPGETLEHRLTESVQLSVPDTLELTIVAGAGAAARLKLLEELQTRWRTRCVELGVSDHADAVATLTARGEAERRRREREQALAALRNGESDAALATQCARLEARIAELVARRDPQLLLPSRRDAQLSLPTEPNPQLSLPTQPRSDERPSAGTGEDLEQSRRAWNAAERRRDATATRHRELAERHREAVVRLDLATQSFSALEQRIAQARTEQSDEALELARETRAARARALEAEALEAARRLSECAHETAEATLAATRRRREEHGRALAQARDELLQVIARLEVRGEAGLYEQWERACAEAERLARAAAALGRRAAAAAALYDALEAERERGRHRYADPLKARIEALGRPIFGDGFEVELDEELRVSRRIQAGIALDFDQLSAGAREQIALLTRLACATLIGGEDGAPLVLDDALGHSDPVRLERLGQILSQASPDCQIFVLTCTPERYQSVRNAHVVQLG